MCKLFEINGQKGFKKPAISSKDFIIEFAQGNLYQSCLASFSLGGI